LQTSLAISLVSAELTVGREASLDKRGAKVEATDNVAQHHLFCNDVAVRGARIRGLVPFFSRAALSTQLGRC
jgi:hypothetical protein